MDRPFVNLDELQFEPWDKNFPNTERPPAQFGARKAAIASRLGARKLGYNVTAIDPGKRAFPRHNHRVNEELFLVLEGEGELRVGDTKWPVRKGDVVACPPGGPETAHQFANTSQAQDLVLFCVSTFEATDVVEYPDTGKVSFGVLTPSADGKPQRLLGLFRSSAQVGYWEGE
jgi:uncharacterized cupin superfamily protein